MIIMKVTDIFYLHTARSRGYEWYDSGSISFVSNGFLNNGVVGHVTPLDRDKVFNFHGICVSAFCEATVQEPPFLPRGNGGSGLLVLEPIKKMSKNELLFYAAYINKTYQWRFSFGRMVNKDRFKDLEIILYDGAIKQTNTSQLFPKQNNKVISVKYNPDYVPFRMNKLFTLFRGDFHSIARLDSGIYPTVSRLSLNNGVVGYFDLPNKAKVYPKHLITISTVTGDAFVQLDDFIATDNVVICKPNTDYRLTTMFFIAFMINRQKWRYSYGRQCYKAKLSSSEIPLPVTQFNDLDENYMEEVVKNTTYWKTSLAKPSKGQRR